MKVFDDDLLIEACKACFVPDLSKATIGQMILIAQYLEKKTGIKVVRMDQGSPGLPMNRYGIEAEKRALESGIGSQYPAAAGIKELKDAASRFIKAFINVDISPRSCVPTTGSVSASFGTFIAATQRTPGKNKILFIDPGFPIQKSQLRILGIEWRTFDIYAWRGEALKRRLEQEFALGDIAAIVYSNPNNPAWFCLDEEELRGLGELCTKYDVIAMEDLAYFCMDYRHPLGRPFEAPYLPTVARYTDNYVLMLSASKIFSYAGQRIALCCISDKLFDRQFPALDARYHDSGVFGETLTASILYMITSGCTYSTQKGYAEMLNLSCDGVIDFVEDTREYERRAARMKAIFKKHGFHVVYDRDTTEDVGDGFFFTIGYPGISSDNLVVELVKYGVSCISLSTTGSEQKGIRACVSRMQEEMYDILDERMKEFAADHKI